MNQNTRQKLFLLGALYFSQGLPFGFFTQALPVFLRKQGISLTLVGLTSLLTIPWAAKFLWAPLVDRLGSGHKMHRKLWILPLQLCAALLMFALSVTPPTTYLWLVFGGVLVANFLAATQDIATDGLAVRILEPEERGLGNGLQVAGYRVGMIVGGGALLIVYDHLQWAGTFLCLGGLLILATLPVALDTKFTHSIPQQTKQSMAPGALLKTLWQSVNRPGMGVWIAIMIAFKLGDAMASGMLRPMLVDLKLDIAQIGWLLGTAGFTSGLLGAVFGGWMVNRLGRKTAFIGFGALQVIGIGGYILPALGLKTLPILYATCLFEHFTGGMATAALFTIMMDKCTEAQGSTDYTAQASIVVIVTGIGFAMGGPIAQHAGYFAHFLISTLVALLGLGLVGLLYRQMPTTTHAT